MNDRISSTAKPVHFSDQVHRSAAQAIGFLMQQAVENSECLSLAAGLVDESTLPVRLTGEAAASVLSDDRQARRALQYGTTSGAEELRIEVRNLLAALERDPDRLCSLPLDQIILTTGSQQLLLLLTQALFNPGDICLVAAPTYFVFLGVLASAGAVAVPVRSDDQGMDPADLNVQLRQLEQQGLLHRVRLIYVVSYFDNPSGCNLAGERRQQIVDAAVHWSREHRILVLEDAAYRELDYAGTRLPSLWSCDSSRQHVILTQTFSKSFAPGIRVGFGVLPPDLVKPISDLKGNEDFGSAHLTQQLMATVLRSGYYQRHLAEVNAGYQRKRDAMLLAADRYFGDITGISWTHPEGGLYVWMTLPKCVPTGFDSRLFAVATKQYQVMYVPGELSYPSGWAERPRSQMRLSFGVLNPEQITEGMQRLSRAVRTVLAEATEPHA